MKILLILSTMLFLFTVSCTSGKPQKRGLASLSGEISQNHNVSGLNKKTIADLQRKLSETASLQQVGPDGSVIFYYLTEDVSVAGENRGDLNLLLNIKICKKYSVIQDGFGCEIEDFRKVITVPYLYALTSMHTHMNVYLGTKSPAVNLDEKYKALREFIKNHGVEMADSNDVEQMLEDEKRFGGIPEVSKNLVSEFDKFLRSEDLNTIRYENEGIQKSIILNVLRNIWAAEFYNTDRDNIENMAKGKLIFEVGKGEKIENGFFARLLLDKERFEYKNTKSKITFDLEGFSYLNPNFAKYLSRVSSIGYLKKSCKDLESLKNHKDLRFRKRFSKYKEACGRSLLKFRNIYINKAFPEIYSADENLEKNILNYLFEVLYPKKKIEKTTLASSEQIKKIREKYGRNIFRAKITVSAGSDENLQKVHPSYIIYKVIDK